MVENEMARWNAVGKIWEIIDALRGEPGCPWDKKQTPSSVQTYLVEEAHEAAAAVRTGDRQEAAEELGDVLFMVLFLIHLYEEEGAFRLETVCDLLGEKMIRRHPHVFGDTTVENAQQVRDNWEKIKAAEKTSPSGVTDSIPASLPALIRAYRVQSRLAQQGGESWHSAETQARALQKAFEGMSAGVVNGSPVQGAESFGELFFQLVNLARIQGLRSEDCLHEYLNRLNSMDEASPLMLVADAKNIEGRT
jgi:MazG family protein